ncbi:MAG: PmbA TldD protein [Bacteroidota bacterium]|nr:PmbA TldD protein [Bacteroidota bacterium]
MKRTIGNTISYIILTTFLFFTATIFLSANDEILRAMRDEIKRSQQQLYVESLQKPYYIEYSLKVEDNRQIQTSLGALISSDSIKTVKLTVGVRIGDYKFDNTNFLDFGFSFFGSGDDEEVFKSRTLPIELDYKTLRRELWLATDAAYKQAAEIYSKKEAIVKNKMRKDTTHDFIKLEPEQYYQYRKIPFFDTEKFENLCRKLSAVFADYPQIHTSSVGLEYLPETVYYVNSEGREYIKTKLFIGLEAVVATQAEDGMPLANFYTAYGKIPDDLPGQDSLMFAVRNAAEKLKELYSAPILDEPYSGPILFEGQAASEIFAQNFAPNLVVQRAPLTENGLQESDRYTAFQSKIGGRVLPEFLSVEALPNKENIGNMTLCGSYKIDDEGVQAQDIQLVQSGYLKNLLSSRIPTRRVRQSNGHDRGGAPMLSVIKLESDETHQKSRADLITRMMKLCKDRELPYGLIVDKVLDQNIMYTTLFRLTSGDFPLPQGQSKTMLVEVYKVYPDGREELVRGCQANGLSVQSFKDILDVGNKNFILNYLAPSVSSPYLTGGDQYVGSTIITPDLLFEDGEVRPPEEDFSKPPILAKP